MYRSCDAFDIHQNNSEVNDNIRDMCTFGMPFKQRLHESRQLYIDSKPESRKI